MRLDPNGNLLWTRSLPPSQWFDFGFPSGLALASNGDEVLRLRGHTGGDSLKFDALARWDAAGNFLWSQAVRDLEPGTQVRTLAMRLAVQGSIVIAGYRKTSGSTTTDQFVAAVHQESRTSCLGDGSAGACPCNNNVPLGTPSGCKSGGSTFGARLDDQGIASLGSDSLRFYAADVSFGALSLLLEGQVASTPSVLQDGLLCLTGPLLRLYSTNANGIFLDLPPANAARVSARSAALGDAIAPGTWRGYQVYFRGATGACQAGNGNLANAVVVDWSP